MKHLGAYDELLFGLWNVGVRDTAVDGTNGGAGFLIVESHALRTLLRNDVENIRGDRRVLHTVQLPLDAALVDGRVRALGLASPAVDALAGDHRRHRKLPFGAGSYQSNGNTAIDRRAAHP
jgi:hypothetical protein